MRRLQLGFCFVDIDECTRDHPCHNRTGGVELCFDTYGSYKCICRDGWTGDQCEQGNVSPQNMCIILHTVLISRLYILDKHSTPLQKMRVR